MFLTIIKIDGSLETIEQSKKPDLDQMQRICGGLIETIPHFTKWCGVRCEAYCNEEGRLIGLPYNQVATNEWLHILGEGPFSYTPQLFGVILIISKNKPTPYY